MTYNLSEGEQTQSVNLIVRLQRYYSKSQEEKSIADLSSQERIPTSCLALFEDKKVSNLVYHYIGGIAGLKLLIGY